MKLARLMLRLLHCTGALRHPSRHGGYLLFSAVVITLIACCVASQVAAAVDTRAGSDLDEATLALCVATTIFVSICKAVNLLWCERLILKLADEVTAEPEGLSAWEREAMAQAGSRLWRLAALYCANAAAMAVTWAASPPEVGGVGGGRALPFVARFPFDVGTPTGYAVAFTFQLVVIGFSGVIVPCADLFNISCVEHLNTLLSILVHRIERLNTRHPDRQRSGSDKPVADADDALRKELGDCISLHKHIISVSECLNEAIGGALLLQVVASETGICLLLFQVAKKTEFHLVQMGKILGYLAFMLLQLLFYCWFSDSMLTKSESVSLAAYNCNWPDAPLQVQRSLLIVSMRARIPLTLRAGKFFVFCRPTFVQVVNVSYSYFTVLRSMSEA